MYKSTEGVAQTPINIIVTEVEVPRPSRRWLSRVQKLREWKSEERLAMLALTLGNACFFGFVVWWFW
jgi:hypothetical protein